MRAFNDPIVDCCGRDAADCDCPKYVATINTPGYLPMDDEPPVFDTPQEAWEYLAGERRHEEDEAASSSCFAAGCTDPTCPWDSAQDYTDTVVELAKRVRWAESGLVCDFEAVGTVYGDTPGYHGDHDLGLAYVVSEVVD